MKGVMTEAQARRAADQLGIEYVGAQEGWHEAIDFHLFNDVELTGNPSTFSARTESELTRAIRERSIQKAVGGAR
jgi:hypothetical protein